MFSDDERDRLKGEMLEAFALAADAYNPEFDIVDENTITTPDGTFPLNAKTYNSSSSVDGRKSAVALIHAGDKQTLKTYFDYVFDDVEDNMAVAWPVRSPRESISNLSNKGLDSDARQKEAVLVLNSLVNFRHTHGRPKMS